MNTFEISLLYFLSGTGNTYRAACWIKALFQDRQMAATLLPIDRSDFAKDFQGTGQRLTVVLFPTHGFMPPWSMIKFLFGLPMCKGEKALVVATRGALWYGPVRIPGAAGAAHFLAAAILRFKGYDIRGLFSVDMAANMINFHPSLRPEKVRAISDRAEVRVQSFVGEVLAGRRVLWTLNNLYEGVWACLLFGFIPLLPFFYLVYGKNCMAKMMFANGGCVSCGLCAKTCPNGAISMKPVRGVKRPFWTWHCENCMRCLSYCPHKAVEAGHSLMALQHLIAIPLITLSLSWLLALVGLAAAPESTLGALARDTVIFLPALCLSYGGLWLLLRLPRFNRALTRSSLTHYFTRYHEPDTRLSDLTGKLPSSTG